MALNASKDLKFWWQAKLVIKIPLNALGMPPRIDIINMPYPNSFLKGLASPRNPFSSKQRQVWSLEQTWMTCFSLLPWAHTLSRRIRFQPQFHHGTHVYLILDISHKDNYLYLYSPVYTVIWSKVL